MPGGLFDGMVPDINGDGQADMLDSFLLNEMINDTEDLEDKTRKNTLKRHKKTIKKRTISS